jgi:stage II sporulation protein AA (anti-sigma F factor antagonist)
MDLWRGDGPDSPKTRLFCGSLDPWLQAIGNQHWASVGGRLGFVLPCAPVPPDLRGVDCAGNPRASAVKIDKSKSGNLLVLGPRGRLDGESGPILEDLILEQVKSGERDIVIDLSQVDYMSSRGLRVVITGAKACQAAGGRLVACSPQTGVKKIIEMTGLPTMIGLYDSSDEAYRSYEDQGPSTDG